MSRLSPVTDPADPRVELYRSIRERDLAGRGGRFIIEGEVVLRVALAAGRYPIESVLIAESRVESLADLLALVPPTIPVLLAGRAVLDAIAGFPMHRGILAIGLRGQAADAASLVAGLGPQALVLVACGIANHDNMGGLFRNAAAFGVDVVLMDNEACDPLYRKAIRVSAGAALRVPFARAGTPEQLVALLVEAGFDVVATSPSGRWMLDDLVPGPRCAVVFGAEGPGLPAALLERLKGLRIAMAPGFDSLNVATSSGIVLHHVARLMGGRIK